MNAGKTRKIHEPGAGSAPTDPEKRITLDAAPPRCNAPRCPKPGVGVFRWQMLDVRRAAV